VPRFVKWLEKRNSNDRAVPTSGQALNQERPISWLPGPRDAVQVEDCASLPHFFHLGLSPDIINDCPSNFAHCSDS
jgi:hypothetical protein